MKKILLFAASLVLIIALSLTTLTTPVVASASAHSDIRTLINGIPIAFDQPAIVDNGRTLVPLRAIFEAMGAQVDWDASTQTITAVREDLNLSLRVGGNVIVRNGVNISLDVPAQIIGGRTLVPLRAVAESFGAEVGWDPATRTITIIGDAVLTQTPAQLSSGLWDTARYRNSNLASVSGSSQTEVVSSFSLANGLMAFNNNYAGAVDNPWPTVASKNSWAINIPSLTENDIMLAEMFIEVFIQGWEQDDLSRVMPFNSTYLRDLLSAYEIYFAQRARRPENDTLGGVVQYEYRSRAKEITLVSLQLFLSTHSEEDSRIFAYIALHEVGHILGLDESLANLFATSFSGGFSRAHRVSMEDTWVFDNALRRIIGDELFWRAAFTSNEMYESVWDANMPVSYSDMIIYRQVVAEIQNGNTQLLRAFEGTGGTLSVSAGIYELETINLFGVEIFPRFDDNDSEVRAAIQRIENVAAFGRSRGYAGYPAIEDDIAHIIIPAILTSQSAAA